MKPLDPETVQRCIDALKGTGRYDKQWRRTPYQRDAELVETWTYHQHPIDILAGLLKPEPTEAEKLVDEWDGDPDVAANDPERRNYLSLAQFILDRQAEARIAEMLAAPVSVAEQPQYVFGPWIKWHGGECPVPGDWMVQVRLDGRLCSGSVPTAGGMQWDHRASGNITHYRVRFEVGKWYDWTGGPCPVGDDVRLEVGLRNGSANSTYINAKNWCWTHGFGFKAVTDYDIVRFRVLAA